MAIGVRGQNGANATWNVDMVESSDNDYVIIHHHRPGVAFVRENRCNNKIAKNGDAVRTSIYSIHLRNILSF